MNSGRAADVFLKGLWVTVLYHDYEELSQVYYTHQGGKNNTIQLFIVHIKQSKVQQYCLMDSE